MSVVFIPTPKVRHIAFWTATYPRDKGFHSTPGRHRAICGQSTDRFARRINRWSLEHSNDDDTYSEGVRRAMRRPVCRRCLTALDDLNDLLTEDNR